MRLSEESHERVERFFRAHRRDPGLVLPPVCVHAGLLAWMLMKFVGAGAITFDRHVFVTPSLIERDSAGRAVISSRLLVHEAAHVLQYEERGFARFLWVYLSGYWRALRSGGRWDAGGRAAAYLSVEEEREARAAENAFVMENRALSVEQAEASTPGSYGVRRLTPFRES